MEIKPVRKGSLMIEGTYRNAEHHAQPCLPMIAFMETAIKTVLRDQVKTWRQGHNVHFLSGHQHDRVLMFRPYKNGPTWGLELSLSVSRSISYPLMTVSDVSELPEVVTFIKNFLTCKENFYQRETERGTSDGESD